MRYLHEVSSGHFFLDHRLTPEVRAMFCAMASRAPLGGIKARYAEVVEAVAESLWEVLRKEAAQGNGYENKRLVPVWESANKASHIWDVAGTRAHAEDLLCEYPLHPRVQQFFDTYVGKYGHSSVMELVGSPSTYTEDVSWYTAYRSFDNRLVKGQEFSTRAVRHRDWPMARECTDLVPWTPELEAEYDARISAAETLVAREDQRCFKSLAQAAGGELRHNPTLKALHEGWFEIFEAEVEAWRQEYTSPCDKCSGTGDQVADEFGLTKVVGKCVPCKGTGKKYPTADKEPFRPALDRARWALPGTIATGFSHTADLRTMARVINDGMLLAKASGAASTIQVWRNMAEVYEKALPGLAGKGLKEAVYTPDTTLPSHLTVHEAEDGPEVEIHLRLDTAIITDALPSRPYGKRAYLDEALNRIPVGVAFRCSLAVARDWHRHRTLMPWVLAVVWEHVAFAQVAFDDGTVPDFEKVIKVHHAYAPRSEIGKAKFTEMLRASSKAFWEFVAAGDNFRAMLCLPLGTLVQMGGQGGLRDVVYMLELRRDAVGANFEYQAQATEGMERLVSQLECFEAYRNGEVLDFPKLLGLKAP